MKVNSVTLAQQYWSLMEKNYDFVLCFSLSSGEIFRRSGFDHICTKLNTIDNYYDLIHEYKDSYVNKYSMDEFIEKTSLDYLITHEQVKFVGLENIENNQERWYEYTIVIDGDFGAFFIQDVHDLHCKMLELEYLSSKDTLTNLYNRLTFENMTDALIQSNRKFALLLIDVDDFKLINDQHGHNKGDFVLKEIASLLKDYLPESSVIARYGGDEFIAYIENIHQVDSIKDQLEHLLNKMDDRLKCDINTSLSIGISFFPTDGTTRKELVHASDMALYQVKKEGKKSFKAFSNAM